ncbi:hypothetical protein DPMN_143055 [Dreissena polymorpha]|uniref:Uncharacterized protein n=1 Tax=Dreissena polymorpha TaxID=45954 RepID=A0A9D4GCW6_DREPO|nr:hypothetical protein DPMN_143055 [Dreissena polymorpha]
MATEFQVHSAGIVQATESNISMMSLTIPRLTAKQLRRVESDNTSKLLHYTGLKKVLPPKVSSPDNSGANYADLKAQHDSLVAAKEKDTK